MKIILANPRPRLLNWLPMSKAFPAGLQLRLTTKRPKRVQASRHSSVTASFLWYSPSYLTTSKSHFRLFTVQSSLLLHRQQLRSFGYVTFSYLSLVTGHHCPCKNSPTRLSVPLGCTWWGSPYIIKYSTDTPRALTLVSILSINASQIHCFLV